MPNEDDSLPLADPDDIRAAIEEADERARLLRRYLRLVLRLRQGKPAPKRPPGGGDRPPEGKV